MSKLLNTRKGNNNEERKTTLCTGMHIEMQIQEHAQRKSFLRHAVRALTMKNHSTITEP